MLDRENSIKLLEDSISNAAQQCKYLNNELSELKNKVNDTTLRIIGIEGEHKVLTKLLSHIQNGGLDFVLKQNEIKIVEEPKKIGRKKKIILKPVTKKIKNVNNYN